MVFKVKIVNLIHLHDSRGGGGGGVSRFFFISFRNERKKNDMQIVWLYGGTNMCVSIFPFFSNRN